MLAQPLTTVLYLQPFEVDFQLLEWKEFYNKWQKFFKDPAWLSSDMCISHKGSSSKTSCEFSMKDSPSVLLAHRVLSKGPAHFNSRRPTSLLSSPFFQPKVQCCHQPASAQDSPEGGCDEVMWLLAFLSLYRWIILHA